MISLFWDDVYPSSFVYLIMWYLTSHCRLGHMHSLIFCRFNFCCLLNILIMKFSPPLLSRPFSLFYSPLLSPPLSLPPPLLPPLTQISPSPGAFAHWPWSVSAQCGRDEPLQTPQPSLTQVCPRQRLLPQKVPSWVPPGRKGTHMITSCKMHCKIWLFFSLWKFDAQPKVHTGLTR